MKNHRYLPSSRGLSTLSETIMVGTMHGSLIHYFLAVYLVLTCAEVANFSAFPLAMAGHYTTAISPAAETCGQYEKIAMRKKVAAEVTVMIKPSPLMNPH
jgi:hypothetical protein